MHAHSNVSFSIGRIHTVRVPHLRGEAEFRWVIGVILREFKDALKETTLTAHATVISNQSGAQKVIPAMLHLHDRW